VSPPSTDDFLPCAPTWQVDWDAIDAAFSWIRKLRGETQDAALMAKGAFWTQDPRHHAEGWVSTHVRLVTEEMVASAGFRARSEDERRVLFAAALLHDVCKPETWAVEADGSITNRGHSRMGAMEARRILWQAGFPFALRERVCSLILAHQAPFWLLDRPPAQARQILLSVSLGGGNDLLEILADADARGRVCKDWQRIIDNVALFAEAARDEGCFGTPYPFFNDHSRTRYFLSPETRDPAAELFDTTDRGFTVTLMSGMPGSGKSSWIARETAPGGPLEGQPVVSMDRLRAEMRVKPDDDQGAVRQAALKRARELLAARRPFVWDAVNLDRQRRSPLASLCNDYGARVRMVYVEAPEPEMRGRNRARESRVPDAAIDRMLRHWEPPSLAECHELVLVVEEPAPMPDLKRALR
jgi:predicted kinase